MNSKYKIEIGEAMDMEGNKTPRHTMIITEDQYELIKTFANIEIDSDLNKYYILNNIKFKVLPYFETINC